MATSVATLAFMVAVAAPASAQEVIIVLTPETDTNAVGSPHTVTANVSDLGVPVADASVHFDVDAVGAPDPASGDDVTDANGEATFTFTNTQAVTNVITACVEVTIDQTCGLGEPADTATKTWEVRVPSAISLAPAATTNEVNTDHTMTATVVDQFDDPVQGVVVLFDLSAEGTPSPSSGTGVTNASGETTFTFTNSTPATNTITACMDTDPQNGECDGGEETATATKTWEESPTCPGFEEDPRNQVVGTPGNDVLVGTEEDDIICGLGGDDTMAGLGGNDLILGGGGDDIANGGPGHDEVIGAGGNDTLIGRGGNDFLHGGGGRDTLRGGRGFDVLVGAGGRDTLGGGPQADLILGGARNDVLRGGGGHDDLRGGAGRDTLRGAAGNDLLRGGRGNDDIRGGNGNDRLRGGRGRDLLRGGRGNDSLNGGPGIDSCAGGPGANVLVNCEN